MRRPAPRPTSISWRPPGFVATTLVENRRTPPDYRPNCAAASSGRAEDRSLPSFSIAADRHAAITHDFGAGDEARFVGGQKQRRMGGVASISHESERNARHALLEQRLDVAAGALL